MPTPPQDEKNPIVKPTELMEVPASFGLPYHGLWKDGELPLPNGKKFVNPKTKNEIYPAPKPDPTSGSYDTVLLMPSVTGDTDISPEQTIHDTKNGYQWLNYAILAGASKHLGGKPILPKVLAEQIYGSEEQANYKQWHIYHDGNRSWLTRTLAYPISLNVIRAEVWIYMLYGVITGDPHRYDMEPIRIGYFDFTTINYDGAVVSASGNIMKSWEFYNKTGSDYIINLGAWPGDAWAYTRFSGYGIFCSLSFSISGKGSTVKGKVGTGITASISLLQEPPAMRIIDHVETGTIPSDDDPYYQQIYMTGIVETRGPLGQNVNCCDEPEYNKPNCKVTTTIFSSVSYQIHNDGDNSLNRTYNYKYRYFPFMSPLNEAPQYIARETKYELNHGRIDNVVISQETESYRANVCWDCNPYWESYDFLCGVLDDTPMAYTWDGERNSWFVKTLTISIGAYTEEHEYRSYHKESWHQGSDNCRTIPHWCEWCSQWDYGYHIYWYMYDGWCPGGWQCNPPIGEPFSRGNFLEYPEWFTRDDEVSIATLDGAGVGTYSSVPGEKSPWYEIEANYGGVLNFTIGSLSNNLFMSNMYAPANGSWLDAYNIITVDSIIEPFTELGGWSSPNISCTYHPVDKTIHIENALPPSYTYSSACFI